MDVLPKFFNITKSITELSNLSHNFCSTYLSAVEKLFNEIENAPNNEEKRTKFNDFANKFTTVPDIWMEWRKIEKESINENKSCLRIRKIFKELKDKSLKHFDMGYNFDNDVTYDIMMDKRYSQICRGPNYLEILKNVKELNHSCFLENLNSASLEIMNKNFTAFWKLCEHSSTMEISKKEKEKVEEYVLITELLKNVENDDLKWMEILLKNGSKQCIVQFIENRIYKNPYNQTLWNLYISYLEREQNIDVLNVYSRYCRLFIDDITMRNQYFESVINFYKINENVSCWILDIVKIEADFVSIASGINFMTKISAQIYYFDFDLPNNIAETFNDDIFALFKQKIESPEIPELIENEIPQTCLNPDFSIPFTLIRRILMSASSSQIQKLQKCCKFLWKKSNTLIIHKLSITRIKQNFIHQNSIFINNANLESFKMEKIWLTNSLMIQMGNIRKNRLRLSKFLFPKIQKCDIRFLSICCQDLTGAEFEYLSNSENIEKLTFESTRVFDTDGTQWCLEKIIQLCPNGYYFRIHEIACNSNTAKILTSLNHRTKIVQFCYSYAPEEFDVYEFSNFIMKNGTYPSIYSIKFTRNQQHRSAMYSWISSEVKPKISFF